MRAPCISHVKCKGHSSHRNALALSQGAQRRVQLVDEEALAVHDDAAVQRDLLRVDGLRAALGLLRDGDENTAQWTKLRARASAAGSTPYPSRVALRTHSFSARVRGTCVRRAVGRTVSCTRKRCTHLQQYAMCVVLTVIWGTER